MNSRVWCSSFSRFGESQRMSSAGDGAPEASGIDRLWERFLARRAGKPEGITRAIYDQYDTDHRGGYRVTITDELEETDAPNVFVPEGWYLRYVACGPQPSALGAAWRQIWCLSEEGKIRRSYCADYEVHVSRSRVEVYVALA